MKRRPKMGPPEGAQRASAALANGRCRIYTGASRKSGDVAERLKAAVC
jgi:hypothetical protein